MEEAKKFVLSTLDFSVGETVVNYKGKLQELLQSGGGACPEYCRKEIGTERNHRFSVSVEAFGKTFVGEADNVKSAEQAAAESALKYYETKFQKF